MLYLIIGIVIAVIVIYVLLTYNSLVKRRNMVMNQKSQIDVELQRRFDLIPNLVEVVKGYAQHERATLEEVVTARSNYLSAGVNTAAALEADNALNTALSRLYAIAEDYPELQANTNYAKLQDELSTTEKKIAFSRQFYNDSVYKLNNMTEMFPSGIIASLFGFKKEAFFETTDTERANVQIDL